MNALSFPSATLRATRRYSEAFSLPDYPRRTDGTFDREAALRLLLDGEYGNVRTDGIRITSSVTGEEEKRFSGKCREITVEFTLCRSGDCASFPMKIFVPYRTKHPNTVLQLNFEERLPNQYCPVEELMDEGIVLAHLCYRQISSDDGDFSDGIAGLICNRSEPNGAGKIAVWSYAASTAASYLLENGYATESSLFIAGHSRLGKTALLTAARDSRFSGVLSNCSGCCGAAIAREKNGETIEKICHVFPYWFSPAFPEYAGKENEMPFDQHFLLALIAPRKLCIVTAEEDTWADTDAQFLAAEAADLIYREAGFPGLNLGGAFLPDGASVSSGTIAFAKRAGTHFFSRDDWHFFLSFIR